MLDNIRIVLIATSHPGNIGSAARAMKTMGLTKLYLVKPKTFPSAESITLASNATDILDKAIVVDSLDAAIADCQFILGTSSRKRYLEWPLINSREGAIEAVSKSEAGNQVAILFGNERTGLTNDELKVCHKHVTIPTIADYASLNLAQAVQVISYECQMASLSCADTIVSKSDDEKDPLASFEQMQGLYQHLDQALTHINFVNPNEQKPPMARLKRLFQRAQCYESEVNILRGICKKVLQNLQSSSK